MADAFFHIEMLPANQGDALWIEYGKAGIKRRIIIDGGPLTAYKAFENRFGMLPDGDKRIELIVISHIDTDHIEGIIRLFAQKRNQWPIEPEDIWFNGWRHLEAATDLGGLEGDFLSALICRRAFAEWNKAFDKEAVVVLPDKPLPEITISDGMKLTLLSPNPEKLKKLADKWRKDVAPHGLEPGDLDGAWEQLAASAKFQLDTGTLGSDQDFSMQLAKQLKIDQSLSNGTSISFLAEYEGKSCLFLSDAHPDIICDSLKMLIPEGKKQLRVDAVKMSHHGSRHNISKEMMKLIDARHFLVSTNGAIHKHPDEAAIATVINLSGQKPEIWFNYRTKYTLPWSKVPVNSDKEFISHYPISGKEGIVIEL
jgi:hypothetical protein